MGTPDAVTDEDMVSSEDVYAQGTSYDEIVHGIAGTTSSTRETNCVAEPA